MSKNIKPTPGFGIIYKATSPSGKVYIGQTIRTLRERINQHFCDIKRENGAFANALNKYGTSIVWEVLYDRIPEDQLGNMERWIIANYDSYYSGYNSTLGGEGSSGYHLSKETRLKMSLAKKGKRLPPGRNAGKNNPNYGKRLTEEVKKRIGDANRGRKVSEETRRKIGEHSKGENNPMYGKKRPDLAERNRLRGERIRDEIRTEINNTDDQKEKSCCFYVENKYAAKSKEEKALEIRNGFALGASYYKLAEEYGISHMTIRRIVKRVRRRTHESLS